MSVKKYLPSIVFSLIVFTVLSSAAVGIFLLLSRNSVEWSGKVPGTEAEITTPEEPSYPFGDSFAADLSAYEKFINPIGDKKNAFLVLVNGENPLDTKKYDVSDLTEVSTAINKNGIRLRLYAAKALEAMMIEMDTLGIALENRSTGLSLTIVSGYSECGADDEHCTGLTVDMHSCSVKDLSFSLTDAYEWLEENSWKFGFVLRYPEGKTEFTGEKFRPWQFRYVGRYHAEQMYKNGLCLEEYLETHSSYRS